MKAISVLLIPSVVLLVSACAPGPGGPGYGGPGGDYGHNTVYVEGQGYDHRDSNDHRSTTNVTDVNVNRTDVNERTVNQTDVKNQRNGKQTAEQKPKSKVTRKPAQTNGNSQQGDQQGNQPPRS